MRVAILAIQHESNTFIHTPTDMAHFRDSMLAVGDEVRDRYGGSHHEVGGFLEGLAQSRIETVPILAAQALPCGAITTETLEELLQMAFDGLDRAGPVDGVLVAPHGAAVCQSQPDMDGYWLTRLRRKVGPDMPVVCTIDPHANLSNAMIDACDATTAYRSNPHLDQRQRGLEAANLMARTLRGEIKPSQACALPPIAINIECQRTEAPPCRPMYDLADQMLERPGVLSNSIVLGFPYADVAEMGTAFIVVTDNDQALAQQYSDELASYLFDHRDDFVPRFISVEVALDQAEQADGPVCLLDMGDNIGGGSPGDGTIIAHAIHQRKRPAAFVAICDADAAERARDAGAGARLKLRVGACHDDMHGEPLEADFTVVSSHEGRFKESKPRHGGAPQYDMGPTSIVRTEDGLTIQLTTRRTPPFSLGQLTSCGLEPSFFKVLVAKGVHAPVAAYVEVCPTLIRVNTRGSTGADMNHFTFHHRRRPLFPFEAVSTL